MPGPKDSTGLLKCLEILPTNNKADLKPLPCDGRGFCFEGKVSNSARLSYYFHRLSDMKKILFIILIGSFAVGVFRWFRSPEKKIASTANTSSVEKTSPPVAHERVVPRPALSNQSTFIESDVMAALRMALANGDQTGLEQAYHKLMEHFRMHPEQVDEYLAVLRSEKNEHVLRQFALALAESESGLLENDKIIQAAIELAKDPSFEQRQHIMLNLMSKVPEMRDDVFQAVIALSQNDPNSQVKTSAVTVLADWMDRLPEKKEMLMGEISRIFRTAQDEDVRGFTYQILALHRDELSSDLQLAISERLKTETDSFNANLLASALSVAPDNIRKAALVPIETAFGVETNLEKQRNLLVQIVCLAKGESIPLLQKNSVGDSLLAQDAREYLSLMASNAAVDPDQFLQGKAIRDTKLQELNHKD